MDFRQVLCAAIEHTIPMRDVKVSAGGLGKATSEIFQGDFEAAKIRSWWFYP